jgi:hypothetical protein
MGGISFSASHRPNNNGFEQLVLPEASLEKERRVEVTFFFDGALTCFTLWKSKSSPFNLLMVLFWLS